jgi:MoaA/NifB/PqqE/SkfB family radical SAM enzyme
MSMDEVIDLSMEFKKKIQGHVNVLLLEEQSLYPDFIELIKKLKDNNLMVKNNVGLLVSNGFTLAKDEALLKDVSEHYGAIKLTLFGLKTSHDTFVKRQGHYHEIIEVTEKSKALGLKVIWQVMVNKDNTDEIHKLIEISKDLQVDRYFVTANYYYSGAVLLNDDFIPREEDIKNISCEIYEVENELFFPEYKSIEILHEILNEKIIKTSLENLYIDHKFDVYPLNCIDEKYLLGNLKAGMDDLLRCLNDRSLLPEAIIHRNNRDFRDLIDRHVDPKSSQMFTAQTLFEKLIYKDSL